MGDENPPKSFKYSDFSPETHANIMQESERKLKDQIDAFQKSQSSRFKDKDNRVFSEGPQTATEDDSPIQNNGTRDANFELKKFNTVDLDSTNFGVLANRKQKKGKDMNYVDRLDGNNESAFSFGDTLA